jgi:hypothetical protein
MERHINWEIVSWVGEVQEQMITAVNDKEVGMTKDEETIYKNLIGFLGYTVNQLENLYAGTKVPFAI